jgi:hypothetical protein
MEFEAITQPVMNLELFLVNSPLNSLRGLCRGGPVNFELRRVAPRLLIV